VGLSGRSLGLLVIFAIAAYLCWLMLQPFVGVLLWAIVLVVVFYPAHRRLAQWTGSPGRAAALSTLLVILTILLPLVGVSFAVARELRGGVEHFQGGVGVVLDMPAIQPAVRWLGQYVDVNAWRSADYIADKVQVWSAAIAGPTLMFVGGLVNALVQTLLVVFTMFYFFRDGEALRHAIYDVVPLEYEQSHDIVLRTRDVIAATIYGVLAISAIQGVLGFLIFYTLGLPSPLLWGVVMFLMSMIPMAGAFVVWMPAAIYLLLTGSYVKALVLAVWGVLVIGSIDNFLSPRLVGRRARLHELLIFFSVLGGLRLFGVLGLILGPVLAAVTLALIEVVRQANRPPSETRKETTVIEAQAEVRQAAPSPDAPALRAPPSPGATARQADVDQPATSSEEPARRQ
jgi:predicted PurR-regulated permease PerM